MDKQKLKRDGLFMIISGLVFIIGCFIAISLFSTELEELSGGVRNNIMQRDRIAKLNTYITYSKWVLLISAVEIVFGCVMYSIAYYSKNAPKWQCKNCGHFNISDKNHCWECDTPKIEEPLQHEPQNNTMYNQADYFCINCKKPLNINSVFCDICGAKQQ